MTCPSCKEPKAHRSHRAGLQDRVMRMVFNKTPYRCHACKLRFYVYRDGENDPGLRSPEEQRIIRIRRKYKWKQTRRQIFAFTLSGLLLLAAIYYIVQERIPRGE